MPKPKTPEEKQRDMMARLHNKIASLIRQSKCDLPETYMVIASIEFALLQNLRKKTGQG